MAALLLGLCLSADVDLSKLPRRISPPKDVFSPKYCCLVFGERAERIVWLALAGDALFVDKNSDGDFDDADEKSAAKKGEEKFNSTYLAGDLAIAKLDPAELKVRISPAPKNKPGKLTTVSVRIRREGAFSMDQDGRFYCFANEDDSGRLVFSAKPDDAPIIHFGGPWVLKLREQLSIASGRSAQADVCVSTIGVGPGSTVGVHLEKAAPKSAVPTVRILPHAATAQLNKRC